MKNRISAIILIFALFAITLSCAGQGELSGQLKILSHSMTVHEFAGGGPQSTAVVVGRAQNVGNINIESAMIAVDFYDRNKNIIASASAAKQNLQPGGIWDFNVVTTGPDAWKIVSYNIAASMK